MADYQSQYTGEQIDEAVGTVLGGGGGGGTQLYSHGVQFSGGDYITVVTNSETVINRVGVLAEQVQKFGGVFNVTTANPLRASVFSITIYDYSSDIPDVIHKFFYINGSGAITEIQISGTLSDVVTPL